MDNVTPERLLELIEDSEDDLALSGYRTQPAIRDTLAALRELERRREEARWIPVTERLPWIDARAYRDVLCATADGGWTTTNAVNLHGLVKDATRTGEQCYYTHWREIGPLPTGEGK